MFLSFMNEEPGISWSNPWVNDVEWVAPLNTQVFDKVMIEGMRVDWDSIGT